MVGAGSIHPETGTEYQVCDDVEIATISKELLYSTFLEYIKVEYPQKDPKTEISDINIVEVLNKAGVQLDDRGEQLFGAHPIHGSNTGNNFCVHPWKKRLALFPL